MRILDIDGKELKSPDLSMGYLTDEKILIAHHEAVEAVEEQWHYETTAVYPNGGKDIAKVIDVPGVEAREAWDEFDTVKRYIPYTDEELEERNRPTLDSRVETLETTTDDMILLMADLIGGK